MMHNLWGPPCQLAFLDTEEAAEGYVDELLDGSGHVQYVDTCLSVSALIEIENDCEYVPDHNELFGEDHHGS